MSCIQETNPCAQKGQPLSEGTESLVFSNNSVSQAHESKSDRTTQSAVSFVLQHLTILPALEIAETKTVDQLIFIHIPKTAGTNVDRISDAVSHALMTFQCDRLPVSRIPGQSPGLITQHWKGGLRQLDQDPSRLDLIGQKFFLSGHFPYSLRHRFPLAKYVTLIRDPVKRELSSANFDYQRGFIKAEEFKQYVLCQMIDNPQVRMIAGTKAMSGACTEATLIKAQKHIERRFLLAAPTDDVDRFIQILAGIQKWGNLAYAPMQITCVKVIETASDELARALRQKHSLDMQFYEWIKWRWQSQVSSLLQKPVTHMDEDRIMTLMPESLQTRQAVFCSRTEIDDYNLQHKHDGPLEVAQNMQLSRK